MRTATIGELETMLSTRGDLLQEGWTRGAIDQALAAGGLVRIRRGWYLRRADADELWPQSRHLAHVVAANHDAPAGSVFMLSSAAVLLGLPLVAVAVNRVHVQASRGRHGADAAVRHRVPLAPDDVVEVDGIRCTSLERTAIDVARLTSPEVAIACADAALARVAGGPRSYDADVAEQWRDAVLSRLRAGERGVRQARSILEMADGRSELPLESVTKLQLRRLGFAQPRLQVPVASPAGGRYWMDMELADAGVFYECDGEGKYTDPDLRRGRAADEVVLAEKRREDWVRGVTGKRVLRGGFSDAATPAALARRLSAFGIRLPSRRDRLLVPNKPLLAGQ